MANLEIKPDYGFSIIEERLRFLTNDVDTMLKKGEIANEAAIYLLKEFGNIANICKDYKISLEDKPESKPISLM